MSGTPSRRRNFWIPLLFFLLLIVGIFIGFQLNKYFFYKRPITTVIERNDRLEEIINLIEQRYVDSVSKDSLYTDAIRGILKHLDPHTVYIPAQEMLAVNNRLKGKFQGIGVTFFIYQDTLMITDVLKNSPASEAGLKPGDQIIKVDSHLIAGTATSTADVQNLLTGRGDSKVALTIHRYGLENDFPVTVKRALVPLYSIDAAYMATPDVGYIKINRFSATTYREFMNRLSTLLDKGMKRLILDLRQNPGGYLDAATAITDEFISKDHLIVYAEGRAMPKESFRADKKGQFEQGRLVVLVDEGSASASEIVAGAVQDWDRGLIIGRRTFGKGLVQEQYELTDGSALRLTVARYFTPSGRNIQRPYKNGREAYRDAYLERLEQPVPSVAYPEDTVKYFTEKEHRVVYGGGGIKPDITISATHDFYSGALYDLLMSDILTATVYRYYLQHPSAFTPYANYTDYDRHFQIGSEMMKALYEHYQRHLPAQTKKIWENPEALQYLALRMKSLLARILYGENGYYYVINQQDTVMQKALQVITTNAYSEAIGVNGKR